MRCPTLTRTRASLAALTLVLAASSATGQPPTVIIADTAPQLTTGTTVAPPPGPAGTYTIGGGRYSGPASNPSQNLFHSFNRFDLGASDTALWTGPGAADVRNVINRVTGGDPSDLYGRIDSTAFANADFYFINPAGIVFGPDARVDVPRAFYASTADSLNFADGTQLRAASADGSTFAMASPASFGFLAGGGGNIAFEGNFPTGGARIRTGLGDTAHFSARNISLERADLLFQDTMVRMAAVGGGAAQIAVDPRQTLPDAGGQILISESRIAAWSPATDLRGDRAAIALSAGDLRVVSDPRNFGSSSIRAGGFGFLAAGTDGGDIFLRAGRLIMDGPSHIGILGDGAGAPYLLSLEVRDLLQMRGAPSSTRGAQIGTLYSGETPLDFTHSRIEIVGPAATLDMGSASISGQTGTADAGDIRIDVGTVRLSNAILDTVSAAGGRAGNLRIDATTFQMHGGRLASTAVAAGRAGDIDVVVSGAMALSGQSIFAPGGPANLISRTEGDAPGGTLRLQAGSIVMDSGFRIESLTTGLGSGGDVSLTSTQGSIAASRTLISTTATGTAPSPATGASGRAGSITIRSADDITLSNSNISSNALNLSAGTGGIRIEAADRVVIGFLPSDQLSTGTLPDGSPGGLIQIVSSSTGPQGTAPPAGISISGREVELLGQRDQQAEDSPRRTRIAAETTGSQSSGPIAVTAQAGLLIDRANIISQTVSPKEGPPASGDAGRVLIDAADITLRNASVRSESIGADPAVPRPASAGDAGAILVKARRDLLLEDRSTISTSSSGSGAAGAVDVAIGRLGTVTGFSRIQSDISGTATAAGNVRLVGPDATLRVSGFDSTGRSAISTSTGAAPDGGTVTIDVNRLELLDGGVLIASATTGTPSNGGNINVTARTFLADGMRSGIEAAALGGGSAGAINIAADRVILTDGAVLTTNGQPGPAGDINIRLPSDGLMILRGRLNPVLITTSSSSLTGGRITIGEPLAIISDGARILALGQAGGANVRITSGFFIRSADVPNVLLVDGDLLLDSDIEDVSEGTQELVTSFVDAFGILISQCAGTRNDGLVSQLGLTSNGPYPAPADPKPLPGGCR